MWVLSVIHQYYFLETLIRHRLFSDDRRPPDQVVEAMRLLDCRLDVAAEKGRLDGVTTCR